jgi:hypothetical protein
MLSNFAITPPKKLFQESSHKTSPLEHHQQDVRLPGHRQRPARDWEHVPGGVHGSQPWQTGKLLLVNSYMKFNHKTFG